MRAGKSLVVAVALLLLFVAPALAQERGDPLIPGETLRIGIVDGLVAGDTFWLTRRIADDGHLELPNGRTLVVAGLSRGMIESRLRSEYDAKAVIISRLDRGEDHGVGGLSNQDTQPAADLGNVRLSGNIEGMMTFAEAIAAFEKATQLHIIIDYANLDLEGIHGAIQISTHLPAEMAVGTALELVLHTVGPYSELAFLVDGRTVRVSTQDVIDRTTTTQTYDLAASLRRSTTPIDPHWDRPPATELQEIIDLIRDTIRPDTWRSNGGDVAHLTELDGRLVITATPRMHLEIERLLDMLSRAE